MDTGFPGNANCQAPPPRSRRWRRFGFQTLSKVLNPKRILHREIDFGTVNHYFTRSAPNAAAGAVRSSAEAATGRAGAPEQ